MSLALKVSDLRVVGDGGQVLLTLDHLTLEPGMSLGIRGPSGAGKSTLLFALAGLLEASGSVVWGSTDLLPLNASGRGRFRAEHMGLIFQDFLLFDELDPLANASLPALFHKRPKRAALRARAAAHLDHLGIPQSARSVASFSGGERQRVAIARALANEAQVLLADEPTASLDRPAANRLIADLTGLDTSVIAVSHDEALLAQMDRVITITDGRLTGDTHG